MVPTTVVVLVAVATVVAVGWRIARLGRCTCQRDEPLAGLGALGEVTARVRRRQSAPHPVPTRSRPRGGTSPCP